MATLANLVIKIRTDARGSVAGVDEVTAATKKAGDQAARLKRIAAFTAVAASAVTAARAVLRIAGAAAETESKFNTVFGTQGARDLQQYADTWLQIAGLTRQAGQEVLATSGAIAQGLGISRRESAEFSKELVGLAADLASFNNRETADVALAIQAAITGEREQLKRLGIVIREADVQQRALARSGKATAKELTNQEKAYATLALVQERAGVAVGDLARTQTSAANEGKQLAAVFGEITQEGSSIFLPFVAEVQSKLLGLARVALTVTRAVRNFAIPADDELAQSYQRAFDSITDLESGQKRFVELRKQEVDAISEVRRIEAEIANIRKGNSSVVADALIQTRGLSAESETLRRSYDLIAEAVKGARDALSELGDTDTEITVPTVETTPLETLATTMRRLRGEYALFGDERKLLEGQVAAERTAIAALLENYDASDAVVQRLAASVKELNAQLAAPTERERRLALQDSAIRQLIKNAFPSFKKDAETELTDLEEAGRQTFNALTINILRSVDGWKDAFKSFVEFAFLEFGRLAAAEGLRRILGSIFAGSTGGVGGFILSAIGGDTLARGPQLSAAGAGALDFANFPPAQNPLAAARDGDWLRFFSESGRQARGQGFS